MNIYWSKVLINVAMLVSATCVIIYGIRAGMRPEQIAMVIVPLFAAAMQMLPAVEKAKTTFPPPPMPGAPPVDTIPAPPPTMTEEKPQ